MRYMIHTCPQRQWYVEKHLIPSMLAQGIPEEDITMWLDEDGKGNLLSCMESFKACGEIPGGTWHLQDDVMICSDFAERTREHDEGIVCGFACDRFEYSRQIPPGIVRPLRMWWSFQCIRIPNEIAGECAEWFYAEAVNNRMYQAYLLTGNHDDLFFRSFLLSRHGSARVENLAPCLVEHVDFLLGGSVVRHEPARQGTRARYWPEKAAVDELKKTLKREAKSMKKIIS